MFHSCKYVVQENTDGYTLYLTADGGDVALHFSTVPPLYPIHCKSMAALSKPWRPLKMVSCAHTNPENPEENMEIDPKPQIALLFHSLHAAANQCNLSRIDEVAGILKTSPSDALKYVACGCVPNYTLKTVLADSVLNKCLCEENGSLTVIDRMNARIDRSYVHLCYFESWVGNLGAEGPTEEIQRRVSHTRVKALYLFQCEAEGEYVLQH